MFIYIYIYLTLGITVRKCDYVSEEILFHTVCSNVYSISLVVADIMMNKKVIMRVERWIDGVLEYDNDEHGAAC